MPPAWCRDVARWYDTAFGPAVAEQLCSDQVLSAGVFALARDAPHGAAWVTALALRHGPT